MVAGKVVCNVKQREAHEWESRGFRPKIHLPPTEERTVPIAVFENSFWEVSRKTYEVGSHFNG